MGPHAATRSHANDSTCVPRRQADRVKLSEWGWQEACQSVVPPTDGRSLSADQKENRGQSVLHEAPDPL